jgi:hypothetical protein
MHKHIDPLLNINTKPWILYTSIEGDRLGREKLELGRNEDTWISI